MLSFEVRKPGGESEIRKVNRDVIHIGASTGNDLVVRARGVLGRHARISVSGDELRLDVLGSAPGSDVTLNGSLVKTAALASGDRIAIGEATITLLNGPAPNPNRISAPPPRGRDAFSVASAALTPAPVPAPPRPAERPMERPAYVASAVAAVSQPRYEAPVARPEAPRPAAAVAARTSEVWNELYARLVRPVPLDEILQEIAALVSASTPVHSLAFLTLQEPHAGEAVAATWKGSLPRLSARALVEVREKGTPVDLFENGSRLRVYPVSRPQGEPVGLLAVPLETVQDPALHDFAAHLAATIGFVHAERGERPFGERGVAPAPTLVPVTLEDPLALLVGGSLAMHNVKASLQRVASARAPILLIGDVGSGKTLVAESIHALSPRRGRPLVRVTATAATAAALEEDLLGTMGVTERRRRTGRLFEADGGTLLIEEVGDLPSPTQALLFRLLEAREVIAPGGRATPVDVRVIGTSTRSLTRSVEDGAFRDDLYFRLSSLTLRLPALRDRREDLPALIDAMAVRHGGPTADRFDVEAMNAILGYPYPGNVRELENEIRRLGAQVGNVPVSLADLDAKFSGEHVELALNESDDLKEIVQKVERQVIERVMRKVRGNQSLGARLLNISRGSLIAKMKEYDIKDFRYLKRQD
jgi:transcriptional regulator with AAA-type ATPase domain